MGILQLKHHLIKRVFRTIFFLTIVVTAWILADNVALIAAMMGSVLTLAISMLCPLLAKLNLDFDSFARKDSFNLQRILIVIVAILFLSFSGFMLYVECVHK